MQALVVEAYEAPSTAHVSVAVDELVTVVCSHPMGWYKVTKSSGQSGWVPERSIHVGELLTVLADFTECQDGEVPISEGSTAVGLTLFDDWWFGISNSKIGYFPATFVEPSLSELVPVSTEDDPGRQLASTVSRPRRMSGGYYGAAAGSPKEAKEAKEAKGAQQFQVNPLAAKRAPAGRFESPVPPGQPPPPPATAKVKVPSARPKAQAPARRQVTADDGHNYAGAAPLQFALLAHNMGLISTLMIAVTGAFAILWLEPKRYMCEVDGEPINVQYLVGSAPVLCDPAETSEDIDLGGHRAIGIYAILLGPALYLFENIEWGMGIWIPADTRMHACKISPHGLLYLAAGMPLFMSNATALAAFFCLLTALVYFIVGLRKEAGDGSRSRRAQRRIASQGKPREKCFPTGSFLWLTDPLIYFHALRNENKLGTSVWLGLYAVANILTWTVTLAEWYAIVEAQKQGLKDGDFELCPDGTVLSQECESNRLVVEYGFLSGWAPIAKASGMALNFNCALILLPVVRLLLRRLNNVGINPNPERADGACAKYLAAPVTRYMPLSKNIEFHKLIAMTVFFFAFLHTLGHFMNFFLASQYVLQRFEKFAWGGTAFVTGGIICVSMFWIYGAAPDHVKRANYYIFFSCHHWFTVFFLMLLLHGPIFWAWSLLPIVLYITERFMQVYRGSKPFKIVKVEWIEPVMALYFRPVNKEDFVFKEGQYLYVACPYINTSEWHPFTISSASDDLRTGYRISVLTGEEVVEVPRPKNLPSGQRWNKFCPISKDWRRMKEYELLEKHETAFSDYVSVHIKVSKSATSWTKRLKDYIEMLAPGGSFPYYFTSRDERGDIQVGRLIGPDGQQVIKIDGPHAAPSQHYSEYGTVMLCGAGIGLTPCASILTALLRYRWRRSFRPEILHFYWILNQRDVDGFQWFVHLLTDLEYSLKRDRELGSVDQRYFAEINIFVTGAKTEKEVRPLKASIKTYSDAVTKPNFTADELYAAMLNPKVSSKDAPDILADRERSRVASNRFQDVFVWSGRPVWSKIFEAIKENRVSRDIGVCYCGAPVIGADLAANCRRFSNEDEDCRFDLLMENF